MEENVTDALVAAGDMLAEALRAGLVARGLPDALSVTVKDGRVVVASGSREVRDHELGTPTTAPHATMEAVAQALGPRLLARVTAVLREGEYDRYF